MTPTPTLPAQPARRRFIQLIGGGAVLASTVPLAGCGDGMPDVAVRPWFERGDPTDLRRWMLAHALLAPNPHNRQPWLADLRRDGEITLVCDGDRLLPETDPFGRQIVIGCGAFIELAVLAAAERGVAVQVHAFPDGEPRRRPAARRPHDRAARARATRQRHARSVVRTGPPSPHAQGRVRQRARRAVRADRVMAGERASRRAARRRGR